MLTKEELNNLIKERLDCLNSEEDNKADIIQLKITKDIFDNFKDYDVDVILETYTHFGYAMNLIYDDNGMFTLSSGGMQPVVMDDEKMVGEIICLTEEDEWFPTIRECVWHYINSMNE